jgi:glyoxylase-like metal-dependent hydrolase (beta-lactamase superfamily II)
MTIDLAAGLRVLEPRPNILAFYDGRGAGRRLFGPGPNWLDDGAYGRGVACYAVVDAGEALVFDTHISLDHARAVRAELVRRGVRAVTVALSHWHVDHVAGNAVFADCEIIANGLTCAILGERRAAIEAGRASGPPAIRPLVLPTRSFADRLALRVGGLEVELRQVDSHSADGTVVWLPEARVLLAGDTLEDPITYVAEPDRLAAHLVGLDLMASWAPEAILPDHGDEGVIASGGFGPGLIEANRRYVRRLLEAAGSAQADGRPLDDRPLDDWIAEDVAAGHVRPFAPYDAVHRRNLAAVMASRANRGGR